MHISRELSENTFYAIQEGTNFGVVVQDVNPMPLPGIEGGWFYNGGMGTFLSLFT